MYPFRGHRGTCQRLWRSSSVQLWMLLYQAQLMGMPFVMFQGKMRESGPPDSELPVISSMSVLRRGCKGHGLRGVLGGVGVCVSVCVNGWGGWGGGGALEKPRLAAAASAQHPARPLRGQRRRMLAGPAWRFSCHCCVFKVCLTATKL